MIQFNFNNKFKSHRIPKLSTWWLWLILLSGEHLWRRNQNIISHQKEAVAGDAEISSKYIYVIKAIACPFSCTAKLSLQQGVFPEEPQGANVTHLHKVQRPNDIQSSVGILVFYLWWRCNVRFLPPSWITSPPFPNPEVSLPGKNSSRFHFWSSSRVTSYHNVWHTSRKFHNDRKSTLCSTVWTTAIGVIWLKPMQLAPDCCDNFSGTITAISYQSYIYIYIILTHMCDLISLFCRCCHA